MISILFHWQDCKLRLSPSASAVRAWLRVCAENHGMHQGRLDYIFCKDDYLLEINKSMLGHDYYTDIITFPLSTQPGTLEAEIYISIDTVRSNAQLYKVTLHQELHRVMVHGLLHLCGYMDKSPLEQRAMRAAENEALTWLSTP